MTRNECEEKIIEHMREIVKIIGEYDANINYLSFCFCNNMISVNNEYYSCRIKPICASVNVAELNSEIFRSDEI